MSEGALSDLMVLEVGTDITGPYCAKLLADYGADVIKIEDPSGGDSTRRAGPFPSDQQDPEASGMFLYLNTNKRSLTLNLKTPRGRSLLLDLVKRADVLVENSPPGAMDRLGLGWEDLSKVKPNLVMTSVSPFGQTGPYRDCPAEEIVVFAMSSRMYGHGLNGREPLRYAPGIIWFQVGTTAAVATMGAIFAQQRFGLGQQIDVSALEALVGSVDVATINYTMTGAKRAGRTHQTVSSLSGVVPCLDGFTFMNANGERFFRRLVRAIGQPELAQDPRFSSAAARTEHADEFDAIFLPWCLVRTRRQVLEQLQAYSVMCAPIQTVDEVFTDPQEVARDFFQEIDHPVAGRFLYPGAPFMMDESPWSVRRPAPLLGQHNEEVLCGDLGLSREELMALSADGVI